MVEPLNPDILKELSDNLRISHAETDFYKTILEKKRKETEEAKTQLHNAFDIENQAHAALIKYITNVESFLI